MKIKWSFNCEWDYDLGKYVARVHQLMMEYKTKEEVEEDLADMIHCDLAAQDDLIYYSFGKKQRDEVIKKVLEEAKFKEHKK